VYLVASPFEDRGAAHGVRVLRAVVNDAPEALRGVAHAAREGFYRPLVSHSVPLLDVAAAHAALENGQVQRGRIVFEH
jgi:NADPH:quinone reductase-like Zn-dependent oxidoreductase